MTALSPEPFFEVREDWLPTAGMLHEAGLLSEQLAAIQLDLVRIRPGGKWHPVPAGVAAGGCPRVRRAAAENRQLIRRQAGLLGGLYLCRACTAQIRLRGPAGAYLAVARHVLAARSWIEAFEAGAESADWPAYVRWTARTPFTGDSIPAMIKALTGDPNWAPAGQAAGVAWQDLSGRAAKARDQARKSAGPPGLRAHAAAARAIAGANQDTAIENELIDAIAVCASARWRDPVPARVWGAASQAWIDAVCLDADFGAARAALIEAIEQIYAAAPVRDVALLPGLAVSSGEEFCSPAEWASAEYWALRHAVALRWCERLEAALIQVEAEADEVTGQWKLLLIAGWPLTADRDRDLAYLACYRELGRVESAVVAPGPGRECSSWTVVLHVPGFAARHAEAHQSPDFFAAAGPAVPAAASPSQAQVRALLRDASSAWAAMNQLSLRNCSG
jgi:hypothetical protein